MVMDPPGWESHAGMGTVKSSLGSAAVAMVLFDCLYIVSPLKERRVDDYKLEVKEAGLIL